QAEDGIRDFHVTGVQTCALPSPLTKSSSNTVSSNSAAMADLSGTRGRSPSRLVDAAPEPTSDDLEPVTSLATGPRDQPHRPFIRSEERRVGKRVIAPQS